MKGLRQRWREYRLKKGHGYVERTKSGDVIIHAPTAEAYPPTVTLKEIDKRLHDLEWLGYKTDRGVFWTQIGIGITVAVSIALFILDRIF